MAHFFPLAQTGADAVDAPEFAARTRAGADAYVKDRALKVSRLETEWLTLEADEATRLLAAAEATEWGAGHIQRYEDAGGKPVLAVTFWKLVDPEAPVVEAPMPAPAEAPVPEQAAPQTGDHTDDLYFRKGRTKKRGAKRKKTDPNQMDLFGEGD